MTSPNRLDDSKLDSAIQKEVRAVMGDSADVDSEYRNVLLLNAIVGHSEGELDQKYMIGIAASMLIREKGLGSLLNSSWNAQSFRAIRDLAYLKAPKSLEKPQSETQAQTPQQRADIHQSLSRSFQAEYCGAAVEGFYEYLTQNEGSFKKENEVYYAKFCSIVQSSGTGKSRMLIELYKKDVIVLYMNLRAEDDMYSYPPRDRIPSKILTDFPKTGEEYQMVCFGFFIALFKTLAAYLPKDRVTRNVKSDVMRWVRGMCDLGQPAETDAREKFFSKLKTEYDVARSELELIFNRHAGRKAQDSADSDDSVGDAAQKLERMTFSDSEAQSDSKTRPEVPRDFTMQLLEAYKKLTACLDSIFPDHGNKPKLVIAIDEAHPLTPIHNGYRPSHILCSVVNEYSHNSDRAQAVWVAFASTTSKVGDFSPPNKIHDSHRVATMGYQLFPPYTQLGWDLSAWKLGEVDVENVSQLRHIMGFGRPLWESLKVSLGDVNRVLSTASSKLRGKDRHFDLQKKSHVLAVMGQRFVLNIALGHPESVAHLEEGVASHMRICLATTIDRTWRFTSYPSEPLLSYAAAECLHAVPGRLASALSTLVNIVNAGMINQGERGELASRLLWLLAKDLFIRTRASKEVTKKPSEWDDHLMDCQMIRVVDWLEFVFGSRIWNKDKVQTFLARESFENAYINFSHWISMDVDINGSKDETELSLNEFTLRHWYRTSAVQCCHQQPRIDKMIPVYMKDGTGTASSLKTPRMSQIFISDKARESRSSKDGLRNISRRDQSVGGKEGGSTGPDEQPTPYIGILADLGQPSSFTVTYPEREIDDRCVRIYAAGVDATTYPFLADYPELMKALQDLVHMQQVPETERPMTEYLNTQVKFSNTPTPEHMYWEQWKRVPDVRSRARGT